jgi:hypothetical protein
MKTIEVKTNIMCGSYVEKVTPTLNDTVGEANWKMDTKIRRRYSLSLQKPLMRRMLSRLCKKLAIRPKNFHKQEVTKPGKIFARLFIYKSIVILPRKPKNEYT